MDSSLFFVDSSAIVHGANLPPAQCHTAPSVLDEFQPGGATRRRLDFLLAGGMRVVEPSDAARQRVAQAAQAAGSESRLSPADVDVLALCLEAATDAILVTDDYTMQDVAKRLGVRVSSVATRGTQASLDWLLVCRGCHRRFPPQKESDPCPVCGSELRLRPKTRSRAASAAPTRARTPSKQEKKRPRSP